MKRVILSLLAASAITASAPGFAYAQNVQIWTSVSQRQAVIDQRIDAGVRSGQVTRDEAARLRADFQAIVRLETQYRGNGLDRNERADLDRRVDALLDSIRDGRGGQNNWQNINQRQAQLDQRIDAGIRSGQLSRQEAINLRAEFQSIVRLETQYRANGLTNAERADLDRRFDILSDKIRDERSDRDGRGGPNNWQNINQRQAQLDQRIDQGIRSRQLTTAEATRLRADFQALVRLENQYRANGLTNAERDDLDRRFDALSDRIRDERSDRDRDGRGRGGPNDWQSIDQRQAQLDQRIDQGIRNRQLTTAEASRLRADFQAIARLEAQYRANGLTNAERDDLDRRFDALSDRIRDERSDRDRDGRGRGGPNDWQSIDQRQAQLDQRIDQGIRNRQLTTAEASRLRADFQAIARLEAQYRANGLTNAERDDLDRRFDALSDRIRDERSDRDGRGDRWENLNDRQAQFTERLNRAVADRRITQRQAATLSTEYNAIARLEQQYRASNGLSAAERADLDVRFDRLQANFRASVDANQYGYGYNQAPNLFDYLLGIIQ